ncbi:MAG: FecR domain-containing protein [Pyrinomonadaceae bacterium]
MNEKHYDEKLSKFLDHELPAEDRQTVGEHLLYCQDCRGEHDRVKFGIELIQNLERPDAPNRVWNKIENELNSEYISPYKTFFNPKNLAFAGLSIALIFSLAAIIYLNFPNAKTDDSAENRPQTLQTENTVAWQVENISGDNNSSKNESLKVGEILETDENSRAKIEVADIGQVEIAPNSLVKLVNSSETEHRLALEYGKLEAKIFAPPRLFVVDTPTAQAVDLGCAYTLDVDKAGNSKLHVRSGYVALERDGRESIVPAGAFCLTRRGRGLGTPFFETASDEFKEDLRKFDFENGGEKYLDSILEKAKPKDSLTLWHLLSRVSGESREKVLAKTVKFAKLPEGVTRKGILELDKNMLDEWRYHLELLWYE